MTNPRIRLDVDITSQYLEGQEFLIISDRQKIATQPLAFLAESRRLFALLDGSRTIEELKSYAHTIRIAPEAAQQLLELLDVNFYLDNQNFKERFAQVKREFEASCVRSPIFMKNNYPSEKDEIEKMVQMHLGYNGPGSHRALKLNSSLTPSEASTSIGLISPHIDFERGGKSYAQSYSQMRLAKNSLVAFFGTSHQYHPNLIHLCAKDFEGPLGTLPVAKEFMADLSKGYGEERSYGGQFLHRSEHSLELQLPFLQAMEPNFNQAKYVPVLFGGFTTYLKSGDAPSKDPAYEDFITSFCRSWDTLSSSYENLFFLLGIDMAHVGGVFGDTFEITPELQEQIEQLDTEYMEAIVAQDKNALFEHMKKDCNARRVCGFPSAYTMIDLCDRLGLRYKAQMHGYHQAVSARQDCMVSFCGMSLFE